MKHKSWYLLVCLSFLVLTTITVAQVKKSDSPFEKFKSSSVNEMAFRKLQFEVEAMRLSLQPTPVSAGLGVPNIVGETPEGKILIQVNVYGSDLPQTVEGRKTAMLESVDRSMAAFSFAFDTPPSGVPGELFKKWCTIQFSDDEKIVNHKGKTPVDPIIGVYENGDLVLR